MNGMVFLLLFFFTNFAFSLVLLSFILKITRSNKEITPDLIISFLGFGPPFVTVLLYYSLLLRPGILNGYYLLFILSAFGLMTYISRDNIVSLIKLFRKYYQIIAAFIKNNLAKKELRKIIKVDSQNLQIKYKLLPPVFFAGIIACAGIFLFITSSTIIRKPLDGTTDIFEYASAGKAFYQTKRIFYDGILLNPDTGFYRPSYHAPGFPLLLTWERIVSHYFSVFNDTYFKSISIYYGILIIFMQLYWLGRKNLMLALLGPLVLFSGLTFYFSFFNHENDIYRIFFVIVSWIYLAKSVEKPGLLPVATLGLSSGFAAFSHSIGVFIGLFNILTLLLFLNSSLIKRLFLTLLVTLLFFIFGGIHYIIDIFFGTGWLT